MKKLNNNQILTLIAIPFIITLGIISLIASRQLVSTIQTKKVKYYCRDGYNLKNNLCEKEIIKDAYYIGDINMDNSIDIIDFNMLSNYINNRINLDSYQLLLADVNEDNSIDIVDANTLNDYLNNEIHLDSYIGKMICEDNYNLMYSKCIKKELIKAEKK